MNSPEHDPPEREAALAKGRQLETSAAKQDDGKLPEAEVGGKGIRPILELHYQEAAIEWLARHCRGLLQSPAALAEQRTGRAIRAFEGKTRGIVHDFSDRGHPLLVRWSLARQEVCRRLQHQIRNAQ